MTVLQWLLFASLAGNALLGRAYLGQRDDATMARVEVSAKSQEIAGVRDAAKACSTAVSELRTLAARRALEAEKARRIAADRAAELDRMADIILAAPPAVPGDACASAQVRIDSWLQRKAQP